MSRITSRIATAPRQEKFDAVGLLWQYLTIAIVVAALFATHIVG